MDSPAAWEKMLTLSLCVFASLGFSLVKGEICSICNCAFVNITRVEPKASGISEIITFEYKSDAVELFNVNTTYDSIQKYFYVDCSSEPNVGQMKHLDWPKLKVLGILANFGGTKWKKLESFPKIVKNQMTVLSVALNLIAEIDDFELDDFTNLKMLNLSGNQIGYIRKGAFSKLNLLKILDLSGNWIAELEDWAFYGTELEYLNLSRNAVTNLTPNIFRGLNNVTVLDLSNNKLCTLPDDFGNFLPSLSWLSLGRNAFQRLPELPRNLRKFDVGHNDLIELHLSHLGVEYLNIEHNELRSLRYTSFPQLKVLRASHNKLSELSDLHSDQLRVLDLSHNGFDRIPEVVTSDKLPFLQELYLDGNPISNVTFPPQSEPFSGLRVVSLSHLKLMKKILRNSFRGVFPKVKYDCTRESGVLLNFSHSSIKFVDEESFKTISLCGIDLSSNSLKTLPHDLLPWLKMSYVNLQDNPWQCDCNIQWMLDDFLQFVYKNNPRLLFDLRCATPLRYRNKLFVVWYNKSEDVFCNSGPSTFYLDLVGGKKIEIWTASAITCVVLACIILITTIAIIVLLCTRPSKKSGRRGKRSEGKAAGPPYYKKIQNNPDGKIQDLGEKCV